MTNEEIDNLSMPHTAGQYFAGRASNGGKPLSFLSKHLSYPFLSTEKPAFINDDLTPEVSEFHEKAKSHVLARREVYVQDLRASRQLYRHTMAAAEEATALARQRIAAEALDVQIAVEGKRLITNTLANAKSLDDLPSELRAQVLAGAGAGAGAGLGQGEEETLRQAQEPLRPAQGGQEPQTPSTGQEPQAQARGAVHQTPVRGADSDSPEAAAPKPKKSRAPRKYIRVPVDEAGVPKFAIATLSLNAVINSGIRAASLLTELGPVLLEAEAKYANFEADRELRNEFMKDRAVKIVLDVQTKMDEEFMDLGFCNWHPFRYFDQMTTFAGIMHRTLAAHGLISSDTDPDIYRRLFDETKPISPLAQSHFMKPCETFSLAWRGRKIQSIEELKERLKEMQTEEPVEEPDFPIRPPPRK